MTDSHQAGMSDSTRVVLALERVTTLGQRVADLAENVTELTRSVSDLAERMPSTFVPRELWKVAEERHEEIHLDMMKDHATLASDFSQFLRRFETYVETERTTREARQKEQDLQARSDRVARRTTNLALIGLIISFLAFIVPLVINLVEASP